MTPFPPLGTQDYVDGRAFWPRDVWTRFARTSDLGEFARPTAHGAGLCKGAYDKARDPVGYTIVGKGARTSALACLNFLIADALELIPDCLTYLRLLQTKEIFRFSAIPQVKMK
jgi:farnesyl-diphosphate farnesyltransferase